MYANGLTFSDKPVRPKRRQRIAIPEASDEADGDWEGAPVTATQQPLPPVEENIVQPKVSRNN